MGTAFAEAGDINRQSIVYHEETPQVFYCPQEKPVSLEGMIVKARPLKALCEHQGRALPDNYISDCWNDVDETEFACSEKERIFLKLKPPGSENLVSTQSTFFFFFHLKYFIVPKQFLKLFRFTTYMSNGFVLK